MATDELKAYAQLAQAAYGYFTPAAYRNSRELADQLQHKDFGKFTLTQAESFAARFELLHQFNEGLTGDGFGASLFRELGGSGRLILSVRGTEPTVVDGSGLEIVRDLIHTDLRIGLDGYASAQLIPLYRYFKQLCTPAGATVQYSGQDIGALKTVYLDQADSTLETVQRLATWETIVKPAILRDTGVDAGQGAGECMVADDGAWWPAVKFDAEFADAQDEPRWPLYTPALMQTARRRDARAERGRVQ